MRLYISTGLIKGTLPPLLGLSMPLFGDEDDDNGADPPDADAEADAEAEGGTAGAETGECNNGVLLMDS